MDAPPIPRLVDLVHAFNGVVVRQFKKRVEKLLSDSIPLWRLLKLLFKFLQFSILPFKSLNFFATKVSSFLFLGSKFVKLFNMKIKSKQQIQNT